MRRGASALIALAILLIAKAVVAYNDPPYYLFPYVPDETDKTPLYYTKVCPVGKTEEKDAEYVVIGVKRVSGVKRVRDKRYSH